MSYNGIGATDPNHPLEVEGQVFVSDVELGNATQDVPFEVYSDYTAKATLTDSRQLRLRVTPSATTTSTSHIDMGIDNVTGNVFFISQPVFDATTAGDRDIFTIERGGNVSIGNNLTISSNIQTGNLAVTSNISTGNVSIADNLTVSGDTSVTGTLTTGDITGDASLAISGDVSIANDLSVTGTITTSDIVGGSPLTISTASNVQILTSNVGIGTVPFSNTRVHIQGGSTASITNSNVFPNFIFSRNANASLNHVGGGQSTARHSLFPDDTGKVWAVGDGSYGALGLGDTTLRDVYTLVSTLDGVANIVASSTWGYQFNNDFPNTSLLDDTGNVWVCGRNNNGQLGQNDTVTRYVPTLVSNSNIYNVSITEVGASGSSSLVLDSTGQIWGAGFNQDYRLGNLSGVTNSITTYAPSMPDSGSITFKSIACGQASAMALDTNGKIWTTGINENGRTGQGTNSLTTNGWEQVDNAGGVNDVSIDQIASGETHNMALDSTGNVWMTGANTYGNLGLGDAVDKWHFIKVTSNVNVDQGVTIKKIAAGIHRSYALDTNGRIWGCGVNINGNVGQPPYSQTVTTFIRADTGPIADKSITDFALSSYASVIARTSDNEYYVTGYGGQGSLGTDETASQYAYTKIRDVNANPPPDYGYTRSLLLENTETGKGPSIELKNSDAVSSRIQMEDGASGKLNIGFVDASFDPKLSGGDGAVLYPFQERAQSNTMTRGVTINQAGGTMVAGGSTSNIGFNTPIFSSGLPGTGNYGYDSASADQYATAFVSTDGKVYIAGNNVNGAYGDGTAVSSPVFIDVTPSSTYPFVAVVDGNQFTYAVDAAGNTWKTGFNNIGQLGLADTDTRTSWVQSGASVLGVAVGGSYTILNAGGGGQLWVTGNNEKGQIGQGATASVTSFTQVTNGAMTGRSVRSVWAGGRSSFVICTDNTLIGSGDNVYGMLGTDTTPGTNVTSFTVCPNDNFTGKVPVQVASSYSHSMMLTSDGQVYATGAGLYYRTGLNSTADVQKFTRCTGAIQSYTITRIAVHLDGSFALDSTGNVWACGLGTWNGLVSTVNAQEFTKITEPAEFYSRTIVNIKSGYSTTVYALDSEGVLWGMGNAIRGVGSTNVDDVSSSALFAKIPLTNMPRAFNYTPTLTLENPNADYGATVEFKNPNNRAFINLDDQTSNLRLGFVNNENNAGQFKGISISPSDNSVYFNQSVKFNGDTVGINTATPASKLDVYGRINGAMGPTVCVRTSTEAETTVGNGVNFVFPNMGHGAAGWGYFRDLSGNGTAPKYFRVGMRLAKSGPGATGNIQFYHTTYEIRWTLCCR
jgi:alpha-tubulin suppressor-like RCC1 family protein